MKEVKPFDEVPSSKYKLPETLYSIAILAPFETDREDLGWHEASCFSWCFGLLLWLLFILPHLVLTYINIGVQAAFIYYIRDVTETEKDGDCLVEVHLVIASLIIFSAIIFGDLKETLGMFAYVLYFPTTSKHTELTYTIRVDDQGNKHTSIKSGMLPWYKVYVTVTLLLPKLALAITLLMYGTKYICYSKTKEELILNTVAVTFILEIDEFLYRTTASGYQKERLQELPSLPSNPSSSEEEDGSDQESEGNFAECTGIWDFLLAPYIAVGFMAGVGFGFHRHYC